MDEKKTIRVHRVGSITFGCVLVLFGVLCLLHGFLPALTYEIIFHLWPCVLILLGIEVLISSARGTTKFVYDKAAVVLLFLVTFFVMCLASVDFAMEHSGYWIHI